MTKKDGDKLRKMRDELLDMAEAYTPSPGTPVSHPSSHEALRVIATCISLHLEGKAFEVFPKVYSAAV